MATSPKSSKPAAPAKSAKAPKKSTSPKSSKPAASAPPATTTSAPASTTTTETTERPAAVASAPISAERPLILDATVHLPGEDEKGKHQPVELKGGQFLDEITDLVTDEQTAELTERGLLRDATDAELTKAGRPIPTAE